ncbi:MAG: mercury methylation corrinoid protein HgcA [Desulfocapsaceae bacterium]|nr:mercury methylation corrinoid protein HgcA [Desulfocapsaceae bacterium]
MAEVAASEDNKEFAPGTIIELADLDEPVDDEVCCGGAPAPKSNPFEKPGYKLQPYVRAIIKDKHVDVALVKTELDRSDHWGALSTRLGFNRNDYKVAPGLYGVGKPDADSEVLVTANYKLTFDIVRKELGGLNCWLLVLDTCGINVWCAAGKGTFATSELVERLQTTRLAEKVNHRRLIVPQLGAVGVASHTVRLQSGFRVIYGPVRATDIRAFLQNNLQVTEKMRSVSFTLRERFILIPVEINNFSRKIWWIFPVLFLLSGISTSIFSLEAAWQRGFAISIAVLSGGLLGTVVAPLLLPWIPGRSFSLKGTITGIIFGVIGVQILTMLSILEMFSVILITTAISSYLCMNFTGSTPYTSPSGVEKEMKLAIPLQAIAVLIGAVLWLISPFV